MYKYAQKHEDGSSQAGTLIITPRPSSINQYGLEDGIRDARCTLHVQHHLVAPRDGVLPAPLGQSVMTLKTQSIPTRAHNRILKASSTILAPASLSPTAAAQGRSIRE